MQRAIPRADNDNPPQNENPAGPRAPCPVDHPGIREQPGSKPNDIPATNPNARFRRRRAASGPLR